MSLRDFLFTVLKNPGFLAEWLFKDKAEAIFQPDYIKEKFEDRLKRTG